MVIMKMMGAKLFMVPHTHQKERVKNKKERIKNQEIKAKKERKKQQQSGKI